MTVTHAIRELHTIVIIIVVVIILSSMSSGVVVYQLEKLVLYLITAVFRTVETWGNKMRFKCKNPGGDDLVRTSLHVIR